MNVTKYIIRGGAKLRGSVNISGAKNAAVAILPASLLVSGTCRVDNVPNISDVNILLEILESMGAKVRRLSRTEIEIDATHVRSCTPPEELVGRIRASYYLIGALLGRFGTAEVAMPGGCNFSFRPIDQHIKGFTALGAQVEQSAGAVKADCPDGLRGAHIYLDVVSVGATMNIMIAATLAAGTTVIENCAKEPHIVDLANFLNSMGAKISGAGTDVIRVRGVNRLYGGSYAIIPDQIEAGTYLAAAVATGGDVTVQNVIPKHLDCITAKLREMGASVTEYDDAVRVCAPEKLRHTNIKTMPYPGFPTDMQPQVVTCLACAQGESFVTEGVYDTRFGYLNQLARMGADVRQDGKSAVINGVERLHGCTIKAPDLRAGAALVIAGLAADGVTEVENIQCIERGYESLVDKLRALGGDICRVETPDDTVASAG